jgi:hypothetical protein
LLGKAQLLQPLHCLRLFLGELNHVRARRSPAGTAAWHSARTWHALVKAKVQVKINLRRNKHAT